MATEVVVSTGSPPTLLPASPQGVMSTATYSRTDGTGRNRVELGGIWVDRMDLAASVERIEQFLVSGKPHQVVTVNLDFLSISSRQPEFRRTLNAADLAVADGMPLVWLSRLRGQPLPERVAGVDLVTESCRLAVAHHQRVFLLGAAPGVAEAAARRLQGLYPGLQIAGTYSPPFGTLRRRENDRIVRMIRAANPGFLFVALGAPRQDLWIREHQQRLQVPVTMGVGCVLDLLAGTVKRAPVWMQHAGLEWSFRLIREPTRLWRRYLINDLPLLARLVWTREGGEPSEALAVSS